MGLFFFYKKIIIIIIVPVCAILLSLYYFSPPLLYWWYSRTCLCAVSFFFHYTFPPRKIHNVLKNHLKLLFRTVERGRRSPIDSLGTHKKFRHFVLCSIYYLIEWGADVCYEFSSYVHPHPSIVVLRIGHELPLSLSNCRTWQKNQLYSRLLPNRMQLFFILSSKGFLIYSNID